ncbi:VanZ family protein [Methanolobus psychrotolerans]|uniref:VanZ family protein n=1 Tax=Methanolobus psychrotolerans TaxID=1874706 RepID=UPI000B91A71F|nr:VanZ family protein [Methanolobus psychrotolerans]
MCDLKKNRYVAYLALHTLFILQAFLNLVSCIQRFDYRKNKKYIFIALTVLYAGFIFYLSSQSDLGVPSSIFKIPIMYELAALLKYIGLGFFIDIAEYGYHNMDKVAHMILYFGLGVLLHLTFRHSEHVVLKKYAAVFAVMLGIIYGITDEFHQSLVPGRTSSIHDLLADGIGVTLAQIIFVILLLMNLRRKKSKGDQG